MGSSSPEQLGLGSEGRFQQLRINCEHGCWLGILGLPVDWTWYHLRHWIALKRPQSGIDSRFDQEGQTNLLE